MKDRSYVKIGVAGPVGSGKTALLERLSRRMLNDYNLAVITNDIYTKEDAEFMAKNSLLPRERIIGVETGGCPHTAIREDASMNLEAVDELVRRFPDVELIALERTVGVGNALNRAGERVPGVPRIFLNHDVEGRLGADVPHDSAHAGHINGSR